VAGKRPINADIPAPEKAKAEAVGTKAPPAPPATKKRKPIPTALKAIAGLVVVAIVFIVAAILGGGGSTTGSDKPAPAPSPISSGTATEQKDTPASEAAEELGYPSFATNNTTRVGGSDSASTAAAIALAVFPSTTVAQRPAAVTLVDESDWQGAIAASVLMSAPARAPLLLATADGLPEPTSQALEALDPQGDEQTGKAEVFAVGDASAPEDLRTTRISGKDPTILAAAILDLRDKLFGGPPAHIVLASESQPEFASPAAAWAARSGDPVLFTGAEKLPAATAEALQRHPKTPIYVLGPSSAISSTVVREAGRVGGRVRRVSGEDPVENAIALARYASGGFGWNINDPGHGFVVARDDAPLDAAIASPLSASGTWGPLLLSDSADTLPKALREYLLDLKPGYTTDPSRAFYNHVWVIGDQEAIDVNQQAEINQLAELAKIGGEP
jgi:hypothetical protein